MTMDLRTHARRTWLRGAALICAALLAVAASATALAEDEDDDADHERARQAYESGAIRSLGAVLSKVESEFTGEVVEVELERRGERMVYEVEILTPQGNVLELVYDAATVELLEPMGAALTGARKSP